MHRRYSQGLVAVALLLALSTSAHARSFLDWLPSAGSQSATSRPGSLSQDAAQELYTPQQRQNSFAACADQFPNRQPLSAAKVSAQWKPMALCSDHFAVLYSQASKTPMVVVERLTAAQLRDAKGEQRTNRFYADPRVPKDGRAELNDYRGSGFDRGHAAPAADAPNPQAMAQTFALTNMVPQNPVNNQKVWNKIEGDVRKFALRATGNVYVYTGPLFDKGFGVVGENQVWVPTRLFKLVYDESSQRAWGYVLANAETPIQRPMDYATFVRTTGYAFLEGVSIKGSIL